MSDMLERFDPIVQGRHPVAVPGAPFAVRSAVGRRGRRRPAV